jgi:TM2 domain-containing membrane protein YozV
MQSPQKRCPVCQQIAGIPEHICTGCGHQFRAQFVQPQQTPLFSRRDDHQPLPSFARMCCPDCGAYAIANQVICMHCGSGLTRGVEKKKKTVGLIALFLGGLGVHKFVLGSWGWGILYIVFCWTCIPVIAGVAEGIVFLRMDEAAFDRKYNRQQARPFRW